MRCGHNLGSKTCYDQAGLQNHIQSSMPSFLIIASLANSFVGFRRPLIQALLEAGLSVHAAAPGLSSNKRVQSTLQKMGVVLHDIPMARTGMNPYKDLQTLFALRKLMRQIQPTYSLGYTIKPVIYGGLAARLAQVPHHFALITGLEMGRASRRAR